MNAMKQFAHATLFILVISFCCLVPFTAYSAAIGSLRNLVGQVDILRGGALPSSPAKNGDVISSGDFIRTKTGAFVEVVYSDGTVIRISQRSRVDIGEHFSGNKKDSSEIRLARGKVQALVDLNKASSAGTRKFEVKTPNAIAGVRGTNFFVSHDKSVTSVYVKSGAVYSYNPIIPGKMVTITPGTITNISGRNVPTKPTTAREQDVKRFESGMTPPPPGSSQQGGASSTGGAASGGSGTSSEKGSAADNESGSQQNGSTTGSGGTSSQGTGTESETGTQPDGSTVASGTSSDGASTGTVTSDSSSVSGNNGTASGTPQAVAGSPTPLASSAASDAAAKSAADAAAAAAAKAAANAAADAAANAAANAAADAAAKAAANAAAKAAADAAAKAAADAAAKAAADAAIKAAQDAAVRAAQQVKPTKVNVNVGVHF